MSPEKNGILWRTTLLCFMSPVVPFLPTTKPCSMSSTSTSRVTRLLIKPDTPPIWAGYRTQFFTFCLPPVQYDYTRRDSTKTAEMVQSWYITSCTVPILNSTDFVLSRLVTSRVAGQFRVIGLGKD